MLPSFAAGVATVALNPRRVQRRIPSVDAAGGGRVGAIVAFDPECHFDRHPKQPGGGPHPRGAGPYRSCVTMLYPADDNSSGISSGSSVSVSEALPTPVVTVTNGAECGDIISPTPASRSSFSVFGEKLDLFMEILQTQEKLKQVLWRARTGGCDSSDHPRFDTVSDRSRAQ